MNSSPSEHRAFGHKPTPVEPVERDLAWSSGPGAEDTEPTVGDYLATVCAGRWVIAISMLISVGLGVGYALLAPPRWCADILVQVEEKSPGSPGGSVDAISTLLEGKTPAETEMEILRSRLLVGSVVDQLSLDVIAIPRKFPLFGGAVFRAWDGEGIRPPPPGLARFAWGGEQIQVEHLGVPERLLGERLTLIAREGNRFDIFDESAAKLAEGAVGIPVRTSPGPRAQALEVHISRLVARPGTEFRLIARERGDAIADLQQDLKISERGKKTGVIQVTLEGKDRAQLASILDTVATTYLRQNVERKSAEAEKTLEFLQQQLPHLKANVDAAELALEQYQKAHGRVNVSLETKAAIEQVVEIEKATSELQVQSAELKQRFTGNHPSLQALSQKLAGLEAERSRLDKQMKALPTAELDSARFMRDAKVATELYVHLLNKAQELRVVKSGTIGNVRILDTALVPRKPVSPRKVATVAISLVLGLSVGVALVFTRQAFHRAVDDPEDIERITGLPVHAAIPHSHCEDTVGRQLKRDKSGARPLLAADAPSDPAVEAVRSLRTSVEFALAEARNNVVSIGGPTQGIGKSFVAVNLAHVMAYAGQRVLLVDADMRRGGVHRFFRLQQGPGLAELIAGKALHEDCIRRSALETLDVLPMGRTPPNPSELLASHRFRELAADLSRRYDVVLFDTPPILPVTDAALIARHSGVTLVVAKADEHHASELLETVRRYGQNGVRPYAVVLNDVRPKPGKYGYGHYRYEYRA